MPILNEGFEDAGSAPGEAAHWTLRSFVAHEGIAGFGPAPYVGWEGFERWFAWALGLEETTPTVAVFEPLREAFEAFEGGWDNDLFLVELPVGAMAIASFLGRDVEDLEVGWSMGPFLAVWGDVREESARFGTEAEEAFEKGWRGNERFVWGWAGVSSDLAIFDGPEPVESFERSWPLITI